MRQKQLWDVTVVVIPAVMEDVAKHAADHADIIAYLLARVDVKELIEVIINGLKINVS